MPHTQKRFHPRVLTLRHDYIGHLRKPAQPADDRRERQQAQQIRQCLALERLHARKGDHHAAKQHRLAALQVRNVCAHSPHINLQRVIELVCEDTQVTPTQRDLLLRRPTLHSSSKRTAKKRKKKLK